MKYYCIGNGIGLIKLAYSPNFLRNLPVIGTPVNSNIPVTQDRMADAFNQSEKLVLCESLEDANKLRLAKLTLGGILINPTFQRSLSFLIRDFPIYEVEVDDDIAGKFHFTSKACSSELVTDEEYFRKIHEHENDVLPNIKIHPTIKSDLHPKLIACHFTPIDELINRQRESIRTKLEV